LALAVPELRALTAHERDRQPTVRLHDVVGVECLQLRQRAHEYTIVPTPSRVKNSSSSACGRRPSRMCARRTPLRSADAHDSSLGIIPSEAFPPAISFSRPSTLM